MTGRIKPACSVTAAAAAFDVDVACAVADADPPVADPLVALAVAEVEPLEAPVAEALPLLLFSPGETMLPPSGPFEVGLTTVALFALFLSVSMVPSAGLESRKMF